MKAKTQNPQIAHKVLEMVAAYYKTTPDILRGKEGNSLAKKVVMHTLKEGLGASVQASREAVGKKYGAEVYQAIKKVKTLLKTDTALASMIEEIKTEALMIAAMPDRNDSPSAPESPPRQSAPRRVKGSTASGKTETLILASGNAIDVIENVQKAVTRTFLPDDLLRSHDPAAKVMLAKDVVLFLFWNDFPKESMSSIMNSFRIDDMDDFYRAIGRVTVCLRDDGEFRKRLKVARKAYTPAP